MKKILMTLAAVLCCWVTTTVFTACGGDDEIPEPKPIEQEEQESPYADPSATPVYASVAFSFMTTPEMLTYCDVRLEYNNGQGDPLIIQSLTQGMVDAENDYSFTKQLTAKLPATFTFTRKITLKEGARETVANMEKISFTNRYKYTYGVLDANYKIFASSFVPNQIGGYPGKPSGTKAVENIEAGNYDKTITFNFDKDGKVSITTGNQ